MLMKLRPAGRHHACRGLGTAVMISGVVLALAACGSGSSHPNRTATGSTPRSTAAAPRTSSSAATTSMSVPPAKQQTAHTAAAVHALLIPRPSGSSALTSPALSNESPTAKQFADNFLPPTYQSTFVDSLTSGGANIAVRYWSWPTASDVTFDALIGFTDTSQINGLYIGLQSQYSARWTPQGCGTKIPGIDTCDVYVQPSADPSGLYGAAALATAGSVVLWVVESAKAAIDVNRFETAVNAQLDKIVP